MPSYYCPLYSDLKVLFFCFSESEGEKKGGRKTHALLSVRQVNNFFLRIFLNAILVSLFSSFSYFFVYECRHLRSPTMVNLLLRAWRTLLFIFKSSSPCFSFVKRFYFSRSTVCRFFISLLRFFYTTSRQCELTQKRKGKKKKNNSLPTQNKRALFFFFRFLPLLLFAFSSVGFFFLFFFFFVLFCPFFPFFGLHQPRNGQSPAFFFVELLVAASFECHSALLSLCFFFFFFNNRE